MLTKKVASNDTEDVCLETGHIGIYVSSKTQKEFVPKIIDWLGKREGDEKNGSWWHGEQVMDFLRTRESAGDQKPFLIFFGFSHPHDPRYGKPELLEKYGAKNEFTDTIPNPKAPPLQENWLPAHPFHHGHPGLRDEERVQGIMLNRDEATIRNELGREYACIENIDMQIGSVLDKLEEMGELENTYIFFTAQGDRCRLKIKYSGRKHHAVQILRRRDR